MKIIFIVSSCINSSNSFHYMTNVSLIFSSEQELGNVIQEIAMSEGAETLTQMMNDKSNVASVFVGRDTRYV